MSGGSVVVFGSLSQDLHLPMTRHPGTGETVMAGDLEHRFGGKGANQALAAAAAGARTLLVGNVGSDDPGRRYLERLGGRGVDVSRMRVVTDAPTGTAIIYVDAAGENMIAVAPGANHRMGPRDLDRLTGLGPGDVLLMPVELPPAVVLDAARLAVRQGARVVLNLAPYTDLDAEVLRGCDPVVVNEHEASLLAASGVEVPSLLITRGAAGSAWGEVVVDAEPVEAVDTTGAGDAYCGTLAARLALGDPRDVAMRAAAAAAARCVGHVGAQPD